MAGVTASLVIICLILSVYVNKISVSMHVLAGICLYIPLYRKSLVSSVLTYIAVSFLAFFIPFNSIAAFIIFFGPYTIFKYVIEKIVVRKQLESPSKRIKTTFIFIAYIPKLIFFNLTFYGLFRIFKFTIMKDGFLGLKYENINYAILATIASCLFLLYDILLDFLYLSIDKILEKIWKKDTNDSQDEQNTPDLFIDK